MKEKNKNLLQKNSVEELLNMLCENPNKIRDKGAKAIG